jgi:hypothetical protein
MSTDGRKPKTDRTKGHLYVKDVPRALQRHFRAWCALRGVSVKDKIVSLMRETVAQTAVIPEGK